MSNKNHDLRQVFLLTVIALAFGCVSAVRADAPHGWFLAGSKPSEFETGLDPGRAYLGHKTVYLKSKQLSVDGFGTLMQQFTAEQYLGKRVRLGALVKSQNVTEWAGLWVRVDSGRAVVAFDNLQSRPIKGTTEGRHYEVVLDVPKDATGIALGILLTGPGEVWLNGAQFNVVGPEVAVTGSSNANTPDKPVNLDFDE
ncbi:MAG TPA: hypothetical protein VF748_17110 [Candidatus Acidoferrum sp.]